MNIKIPNTDLTFKSWDIGKLKNYLVNVSSIERDNDRIDCAFSELVNVDCNYSHSLKLYILLYMRVANTGDLINITYNCSHCGSPTEGVYSISDAIKYQYVPDYPIVIDGKRFIVGSGKDLATRIKSIDGVENVIEYLDNLSVAEYNELNNKIVDNNGDKLVFTPKSKCVLCNNDTTFNLDTPEIIDLISELTLQDYYQSIINMKIEGGFSISETNSMLPFERSLYINLINKQRSDD